MANFEAILNQREFPRRFVHQDADLSQWEVIEPYFQELKAREIHTYDECEKWLFNWSELSAAIAETGTVRYIEMTCDTDNTSKEAAHVHFVENISPKCEPYNFELNKKLVAYGLCIELPKRRYFVMIREIKESIGLFRQENIELNTQDEILGQQYYKVCGEQQVSLGGEELTLPQVYKRFEETDRTVRREAWTAAVARQLADRDKLETIFDEMLAIRQKMAEQAGFSNFLDYQFRRLGRFDYGVKDCEIFHKATEKHVLPLRNKLRAERARKLGLGKLAPFDLDVDVEGRPPMRPFKDSAELVEGTRRIIAGVSEELAEAYDILSEKGLLDLDSRKGKAPGGYQSTLDESRLPFIFMNAAGRNQDVFTLLHEFGHAYHALAHRNDPLHAYRGAPIEFCEVASMGMEMMACESLEAWFTPQDAARAKENHLESVVTLLPSIMRVDAFQHWLYRHPGHSREERAQAWRNLEKRFGDDLEWPAHEEWRDCSWLRTLHYFVVPLYYIEYGIAQLGATQLWLNFLTKREETLDKYKKGLSLGNSVPLPELFQKTGLQLRFDAKVIEPLMRKLDSELFAKS